MASVRKPLQGVGNIVRFNWPFYAVALALALGLGGVWLAGPPAVQGLAAVLLALLLVPVAVSLVVSAWVYDFSDLYQLTWLPKVAAPHPAILTVNAGFDEISAAVQQRYAPCSLQAVDFYDPARHTEASIRRARRAYPPYPGTRAVGTTAALPVLAASIDLAVAFLATHEIRAATERAGFLAQIRRVLKPDGRLVVTEHLRDPANFLAYNIGFFHFHSRQAWLQSFCSAGFEVEQELRTTPFITTFLLRKNGNPA